MYSQQPGASQLHAQVPGWMERPQPIIGCPQGLEYLGQIDQLVVHQKKEMLEILTEWETANKYVIKNSLGQQVYYAFEESSLCGRQCLGAGRAFVIHIVDNFKREVMRLNRPFKCCAGWCCCSTPGGCCSVEITVEAPPGNVIGTVQQRRARCSFAYVVKDADGSHLLDIDGPCFCSMLGCGDKIFQVRSTNGENIGEVRKKWAGIVKEAVTDADNFGINFPMDLAVRAKAILIGALFLIDFMAFESQQQ